MKSIQRDINKRQLSRFELTTSLVKCSKTLNWAQIELNFSAWLIFHQIHIHKWLIKSSNPNIYSVISAWELSSTKLLLFTEKLCRAAAERGGKVNFYQQHNTNCLRKQMWVRSCVCTITLLMMKTMKTAQMEHKRISNKLARAAYTSAITAQKYTQCFEMKGGELKGRRKSILNISFQSNVNNLCCLCFLLLLFIYLLLSFQQPARFSKASWTGKLYQTLNLVSKGFLLFYLYISSSLHLSCCYLVRQTHNALMRSMYSFLSTRNKSE